MSPEIISLTEIEKALDTRQIFVIAPNGHHWSCRRNGRTKLWKTRPDDFQIPVKIGFRDHSYISHNSFVGYPGLKGPFDYYIQPVSRELMVQHGREYLAAMRKRRA